MAGRPTKDLVRLAGNVTPELKRAVAREAFEREMTLGELIEEAFRSRVVKVTRSRPTENP